LNVRKNVEFGLKNKKFPKDQIAGQTDRFLKLMQIDSFANRMPDKLSGGQQQRVALARALVIQPDVLLMDEPLSNLDAKLRVEMRSVIKQIQHSVGITTIYVTHDQEEAMAVSDRIAVMDSGVIQHIGTPKDIYQRPTNIFVSTFIGLSNILKGRLRIQAGKAILEIGSYKTELTTVAAGYLKDQDVQVSVRPEEFLLSTRDSDHVLSATVDDAIFLGLNTHYHVSFDDGTKAEIIQESTIDNTIRAGSRVSLGLNTDKINVFSADGRQNLLSGVRNDAINA
jgi:iron(III) transport system ATP-binding protein